MSTRQPEQLDLMATEYLARAAVSMALLAVAVIHIVDLPNTWQGTPLIGYAYLLLIAAALLAAAAMPLAPEPARQHRCAPQSRGPSPAHPLSPAVPRSEPLDVGPDGARGSRNASFVRTTSPQSDRSRHARNAYHD